MVFYTIIYSEMYKSKNIRVCLFVSRITTILRILFQGTLLNRNFIPTFVFDK